MSDPTTNNPFLDSLVGNPMLAFQIGIIASNYAMSSSLQAVATERATLVKLFTDLANEHDSIDDEDSANTAYANAYRDAADKVRQRG